MRAYFRIKQILGKNSSNDLETEAIQDHEITL